MVFMIKFLKKLARKCSDDRNWEWAMADVMHCITCMCTDFKGDNLEAAVDLGLVFELQFLLRRRRMPNFPKTPRSLKLCKTEDNCALLLGGARKSQDRVDLIKFIFPPLFKIATSTQRAIREKFQMDEPEILISLLSTEDYGSDTLDILRQWMLDDAAKVERFVCRPETIEIIVNMMTNADSSAYYNILEKLENIIATSIQTNLVYGQSKLLLQELCSGLSTKYASNNDNNIRIIILKILHKFLAKTQKPDKYIKELDFVHLLTQLSEDNSVIICKLSKSLLEHYYSAEENEEQEIGKRKYTKKKKKNMHDLWRQVWTFCSKALLQTMSIRSVQ